MTKNVYDKKADKDGLRVLVMRFWPRGKGKDSVDLWLKDLGPTPALIKRWKAGEIEWQGFRKAYLSECQGEARQKALAELKSLLKSNKTVICSMMRRFARQLACLRWKRQRSIRPLQACYD